MRHALSSEHSKVFASSIARSVRALRSEGSKALGVEVARGMTDTNATCDVDHLLNYFGLSLKVPRDTLQFTSTNGDLIELPWIRPSAWVKYLIEKYPRLLSGNKPSLEDELEAFWTYYKKVHPEHAMFVGPESRQAERMRCTVPLLVHGDEGRYLKRSNFMVCSIECPLGSDEGSRKSKACSCASDKVLQRYTGLLERSSESNPSKRKRIAMAQKTNSKGHCFLSKFLCFGMQSKFYKDFPGLLSMGFAELADDMTSLIEQGVSVGADRYYAGFLGIKGDLKFHVQIGNLTRSYYNVGVKNENAICHLCMAGSPGIAFEEVSDDPIWESTMFQQTPWVGQAPPLGRIPHDSRGGEASFKLDLFHCWKVGLGRDLVGSSIMYLALAGKFDDPNSPEDPCNVPARLERAHGSFRLWCLANHKTASCRSFTKFNMMAPDLSSFPWFNAKGSDTTLATHWLLWFLRAMPPDPQRIYLAMQQCFNSAIVFFDLLHSHGLWLHPPCAQRAQHHLSVMLRGYKFCAAESHRSGVFAYGLKPKIHALHHVNKELLRQLRLKVPLVLSPMIYSCESNEDNVGRISRLARRVSSRTCNARVFDRVMFKTKALLKRKFLPCNRSMSSRRTGHGRQ